MEKTVLITGGSRGIGKSMVEKFAKANYKVIFFFNKSNEKAVELQENLTKLGFNVTAIQVDITNPEMVKERLTAIYKTNKIDVLINNAGICLDQKMLIDTSIEEWQNVFNVNVNGMFFVTKFVVEKMMFTGGKIINLSSMWGISGGSCEVCYSASKSAIIGFTKALAKEVGSAKINVNCIAPGVIKTDMNSHLTKEDISQLKENTPIGEIGKPEDIANLALFLASENANFITGQIISSDGGYIV